MSGPCETCPFGDGIGINPATEQAINLGCLPDPFEALAIKRATGCNWGCHSERRVCAGFVREAAELGIEYRNASTLNFATWSDEGLDAAVREARA